jgi:hypothetical protein
MNCEDLQNPTESDRRLVEGLRCLGAESRRREAPGRVERRLVAAFRGNAIPIRQSVSRWWIFGSWAAALAVTAGLAFFVVRTHQPERTQRIPTHRRMTQLATVEQPSDAEMTDAGLPSGFIPLPNAEDIAPNEAVNVVRVELPRSTVVALGLVGEDEAEEAVQADVILGADGIARAVRFLD